MLKMILILMALGGVLIAIDRINRQAVEQYRQNPDPTGFFVNVRGSALYARVLGNLVSGGVSVVVFTDAGEPSALWWNWQDALNARALNLRSLCFDRPNLGWSSVSKPPTPNQAAQDAYVLAKALQVTPPYILVGHGYGALIARAFMDQFPQDTHALLLVEPYLPPADLRKHVDQRTFKRLFDPNVDRAGTSLLARSGLARFTPPPYPLAENQRRHWQTAQADIVAVRTKAAELRLAQQHAPTWLHQNPPETFSQPLTVLLADAHHSSEHYIKQRLDETQIRSAVEARFMLSQNYVNASHDGKLEVVMGYPALLQTDALVDAVLELSQPPTPSV
jgi:pimeloyl-ACP methyl ester carboxylesterase